MAAQQKEMPDEIRETAQKEPTLYATPEIFTPYMKEACHSIASFLL